MADKGCGRIDDHQPHPWVRPRLLMLPARTYQCSGTPTIEGGSRRPATRKA